MSILVIAHDLGTTDPFRRALRDAGFEVDVAQTGFEGLRLARRVELDLILSDLHPPDLSGLEILATLRSEHVGVPFLIITGLGSIASALEAGRLGAAAYVEEPISIEALLALV